MTTRLSYLPYRMNAFLENGGLRTICNKFLHLKELIFATSFQTHENLKDESPVARKSQFVLYVVDSALLTISHVP